MNQLNNLLKPFWQHISDLVSKKIENQINIFLSLFIDPFHRIPEFGGGRERKMQEEDRNDCPKV